MTITLGWWLIPAAITLAVLIPVVFISTRNATDRVILIAAVIVFTSLIWVAYPMIEDFVAKGVA